jgi:O-antigen/teichoic acid export membrane protein
MSSFGRRVFEGTTVLTLSGFGGRLLGFATVPVLTRVLGPEPYSIAALLNTAGALGAIVALAGIDMAYLRFAFQGGNEQQQRIERLCWNFALTGAVAAGLLGSIAWAAVGSGWVSGHRPFSFFVFATIVLSSVMTMAGSRARILGRYNRLAFATVIAALISAAASLCVGLLWRADVWALLSAALAGPAAMIAILGIPPLAGLLRPSGLARDEKMAVIGLGLAGSITSPVYWLIFSLDRWFVVAFAGPAEAGIYVMAAQIAAIGMVLNSSVVAAWFPEISQEFDRHDCRAMTMIGDNCARIIALMAVAWVAVSAAGGDIIRLIAAEAFHSAGAYVPWLAAAVLFHGISNVFVSSMFLARKMRLVAAAWLAGGAVGLLLYYVLTAAMGPVGAAIAQMLALLSITLIQYFMSQRIMPLPLPWIRLGVVALLALVSVVIMSVPWANSPMLSLAMKTFPGLTLAAATTVIIAPGPLKNFLRTLSNLPAKN